MNDNERRNLLYQYKLSKDDKPIFDFVIDHQQTLTDAQSKKIELLTLRVEKLETFHEALIEIKNQIHDLEYRISQLEV